MTIKNSLLIILTLTVIFSACDSHLNLAPEDTIVEDKVFEKFTTAESAVAGTYHLLFNAAIKDYITAEATAPTCEYSTGAARTFDPINNGSILPEDGLPQNIYEPYYAALNQANLLIFKIPVLGKYKQEQMEQHIAEAKFIRAYAYHRLLAWFGDGALMNKPQNNGLVLYLEHYDGFDINKDIRPRSTNEQVYAQIIQDLEEAIPHLPDPAQQDDVETRVSRANMATCEALLARVYMYKRDYVNAALWAEKVLARTAYNLESDVLKVFPPNQNGTVIPFSSEHMFGFPVSSNGGNWQFGGNGIYYVYNSYWFSDALLAQYQETDQRRVKLMREAINTEDEQIFVTNKYPNSSGRDNVTIMRLPEIMLTRAEALARNSGTVTQEMVNLLNQVHLRANPDATPYQTSDFANPADFILSVLTERSKELAFEGLQRFDQLRTDRPLYNPELPDNKKVLPIPLREINISNGVVQQNEGYVNN
ncbi:SusD family protein [Saccharicrinis carchari]|uniref:SusD family protein n=1 Tax=Saccharicrinis carchari TaxID=1168039 RepID=A0A521EI05_SACCC|nr:RagB/SusD family nutrient uptake outer membrane protein [Saccharicrinis carchari]SMO83482.1 SusD family protein [Saccharicrinis carchari]